MADPEVNITNYKTVFAFRFGRGESEKSCRIVVIDDSLYEPDENFHVKLTSPMGGRLGNFSTSEIVVLADEDDGRSRVFTFTQSVVIESLPNPHALLFRVFYRATGHLMVTVGKRKCVSYHRAGINVDAALFGEYITDEGAIRASCVFEPTLGSH